jgi:glycine cleavage system aminomethyltransferase T
MALVEREAAAAGTSLDVVIRDAVQPARVVPLPFYSRPRG